MEITYIYFLSAAAALISGAIGFLLRKFAAERGKKKAEENAKRIVGQAAKEAENKKREAEIEVKDEIHKARTRFEEETRERRQELLRLEKRLEQREQNLERKVDFADRKEKEIRELENSIQDRSKALESRSAELEELLKAERQKLQQMSGLSAEEARDLLLAEFDKELRDEKAAIVRKAEKEIQEESEKKSRDILSLAIQKYSQEEIAEASVDVVPLPSDDMKGRIIGREGRNIRAFETATGINLIIDDTPEAVVLSGFNGVRREIARRALERLVSDGRIHPGRIEEVIGKVKKDLEIHIREEGEKAAFDLGIENLHSEELALVGRLKFRSSYGQNALQHSKETAYLAGIMAAEIGADQKLARRAGLLHDIGKSIDHEVEGTHVQIGADLAKKFGEPVEVIESIETHHGDKEAKSVYAVLVQAADTLSAARPGARRETWETYIKRLESLEKIGESFPGVDKCYAIQAGRELRIMVKPEKVKDQESALLAREVSKKIEKELEYPGQIKITLVRETRVVDYAK